MQQFIVNIKENHDIHLPPSIMEQAQLHAHDHLEVIYKNGFIVLRPAINFLPKNTVADNNEDDILSFAGMFRGVWGDTTEEVDKTLNR